METLSIHHLIKDSPAAVAILDTELRFKAHSEKWLEEFRCREPLIGKSYYDLYRNTPPKLRQIFEKCLEGHSDMDDGHKFIHTDGRIQWLKWKVSPWRNDEGIIKGLFLIQSDITEQKREEELLSKAEKVAGVGGWEVDLVNNRVYWTAVTKEIHEVPYDFEPNLEEGIQFYKAGIHRRKIRTLVGRAIEKGLAYEEELLLITAKGNEVWVRAKGEAEFLEGRCVRLFGTFQDIDAQKRAETEFNKTAERLKIATEAASIGIWEYDIIHDKLDWDDNMYRLYGMDKHDFADANEAWESNIHPEDKLDVQKAMEMAISGEKDFNSEFRVIKADGNVHHIYAIGRAERNAKGKAVKIIGANWDISALKTTEIKLLRSQESLARAFQNSPVGMAIVAPNGKWIRVNESICTSLGYTENELMQMTFQDITHPDDLYKDLELLEQTMAGQRNGYKMEKRYFHQNGHLVHAILHVTAVHNVDGSLSHFISEIIDITESKRNAEKLKQLLSIAEKQNDSLTNFAHIVSHNLRSHANNLSMLSGFLTSENDEGERNNLLGMLGDACEGLEETVLHLNDVVQINTGTSEKMEKVNLYKTLSGVKKNLRMLLKEKNAQCFMDIPENILVQAVPAYLDSIFLNLFTNSLKYCSPDRDPDIAITMEERGHQIIIFFTDNGLGIDLGKHGDKLFGMFKTFHRHKDAKGIGLFITKNQIEAMKGTIEVQSRINQGTTFQVTLEKAN